MSEELKTAAAWLASHSLRVSYFSGAWQGLFFSLFSMGLC